MKKKKIAKKPLDYFPVLQTNPTKLVPVIT